MMTKSYSTPEIKGSLRRGSQIRLSSSAHERIRALVLATVPRVTQRQSQRYTIQELINYHLSLNKLHPMIAIIIALVLFAGTTSTALAADNAKPGDALFSVDQALEQARLAFAFSDEAKSNAWFKIAEERESELQQLITSGDDASAEDAEEYTSRALENALTVINRVQDEDRGESGEALDDVAERLAALQNRFTERLRERTRDQLRNTVGSVELEAEIENNVTKVKIKINSTEQEYTLTTTDIAAIIESIRTRTGLSTEDITILLKLDGDEASDADDDSDDSNQNGNQNVNDADEDDADEDDDSNQNSNRGANGNANSQDEDDDEEENENENSNENVNDDDSEDNRGQSNQNANDEDDN